MKEGEGSRTPYWGDTRVVFSQVSLHPNTTPTTEEWRLWGGSKLLAGDEEFAFGHVFGGWQDHLFLGQNTGPEGQ